MSVITEKPPQFNHSKVQKLIQSLYGFEVSVSALDSERDQNFKLKSNDGNDYVLKISNPHELPLSDILIDMIGQGDIDDPLFPTLYSDSERKLNDNLKKPREYMQEILKVNGKAKATLLSFRTTFNNTLRDLGLDVIDRQILLTHASSETTKIYTHPNLDLAREWVNKIPVFN